MAFIPYPDGVQAVIQVGGTGYGWTNTLWFELLDGQSHDLQELADYLHDWYGSGVMPELADDHQLQQVKVYDMASSYGQIAYDTKSPVTGGQTGDPSPLSVALVVTLYTNVRGRTGRGRNYVAGFIDTDVGQGSVGDALRVTNITTAYTNLMTAIQTNTNYYWVVASRQLDGVPRSQIIGNQITSVVVRNAILGHQRRRIARP